MLQGAPAFPGVTDVFEQLQKIWTVRKSLHIITVIIIFIIIIIIIVIDRSCVSLQVLGVPSEDSWPGVSQLPNYKPGQ